MLARVLAMALCLSDCLSVSVTSRSSIETDERIELIFGKGASFHLSYTVLKENSGNSKNKGTFLWNFVPNFGISIVETCHRLKLEKVGRSESDQLDRRRATKLTIPASSDARPLVYHSIKLCLQHDSVARSISDS